MKTKKLLLTKLKQHELSKSDMRQIASALEIHSIHDFLNDEYMERIVDLFNLKNNSDEFYILHNTFVACQRTKAQIDNCDNATEQENYIMLLDLLAIVASILEQCVESEMWNNHVEIFTNQDDPKMKEKLSKIISEKMFYQKSA